MKKFSFIFSLALVGIAGCKKKDDPVTVQQPPAKQPSARIHFANMAGDKPLVLKTETYKNENGDDLQVNVFQYFISNIKFYAADGSVYAEPESYHLIDASNVSSQDIDLYDVPAGKYTRISYIIGVDSARNVSGAQTGALDMASGMFWDWNSGYIMLKLEGRSPQSTLNGALIYHTGGFSGLFNVLRTVQLNTAFTVPASPSGGPSIHIAANVLELFKTPNKIDFNQLPVVSGAGQEASMMADNYADMFSVDHID